MAARAQREGGIAEARNRFLRLPGDRAAVAAAEPAGNLAVAGGAVPVDRAVLPALQHGVPPLLPDVQQYPRPYAEIYTITNRFDYAGVNMLISGSTFPPLYYGMYCQLEVAIIYLTCIICFAAACFVICLF